ncbi:MAG: twin-arginine translocation signal domain-containing protein, partial [Pseudomonadales bacterium]
MTSRRKFIQGAAIAPAAALATPALAQSTIKWRMQTYAGASLAAEVIVPAIKMFNKIALIAAIVGAASAANLERRRKY